MDHPAKKNSWALVEAVVASTIGTTIEWYDFFLYGTAAGLIFPKLFFPDDLNPFYAQILSYATFSLGFVGRLLGSVVFGYLGDRVGRKSTLVATLLLMGVSTVLIGCMPTYGKIGIAAPLLLAVLRIAQGLGVGGEWGGSVLLVLEYGHRGKRGFFASWPQAGVPLGLLSSTGVWYLVQRSLPPQDFNTWGWRLPFFLSGLLIVVGLVIRVRLLETPLFAQLKASNQIAQAPIRETLVRHWREVLLGAGIRLTENACFYLFSTYILRYDEDVLHVGIGTVLLAVNLAAAAQMITMPLYGILSDYWSRRRAYIAGCVFLIVMAWPYYALLDTREPALIVLASVVVLAGGHALLYSVQGSLIPELFGTRVRYSGALVGYQLGALFGGGLALIIATSLVKVFPENHSWALAFYVVVISIVSLVCVLLLPETSRKDISEC